MAAYTRLSRAEFEALPLRVHDFLRGVPIEDIWAIDLEGGPAELTLQDCAWMIQGFKDAKMPFIVTWLFRFRNFLGRVFGWDKGADSPELPATSYIHNLTDDDCARSFHEPGITDPPQRLVYDFDNEVLGEIINKTVHAFVHASLHKTEMGHRMVMAVYVKPVGAITRFYMALIKPFRHLIIYPALLQRVRRLWAERYRASAQAPRAEM